MHLHNARKNLFHPIAAYSRSMSRVTRRASAFGDLLFEIELEYRGKSGPGIDGKRLGDSYDRLLDAYEAFLFSFDAHFDDLRSIALCFYSEPAKGIRCASYRRFLTELEAISTPTSYVVNKIKHNLASLGGFYSVAGNSVHRFFVPGFMLVRVIGEGIGPDPDFAGYERSAISFYSDFRRSLCTFLVASACLADFLAAKGVVADSNLKPSGDLNDVLDMLCSVSRLSYPSENQEFITGLTFSLPHHKRAAMPCSMRDGPPPADLVALDWAAMYTGDGITRTFSIPAPIRLKN